MAKAIMEMLHIGKIYRLKFPGIAARVIKSPPGQAPSSFPYLVESVFLKSRWYVNANGEPAYPDAPQVILRPARCAASASGRYRKCAERLR
jgi:hypothetical protein